MRFVYSHTYFVDVRIYINIIMSRKKINKIFYCLEQARGRRMASRFYKKINC